MKAPDVEQHTIGQSIILHLLPGILIGAFYYAIAQPIRNMGYPSLAAFTLAAIVILIPFELGFLLYQGKKKNGALSLEGIVLYRQQIPLWQYLVWVPVIFILVGLIFTGLTPVSSFLETMFTWLPEALRLDMVPSGEFSKSVLINTYLLAFIFIVLIAPTVEELYFRGYLLPRMPQFERVDTNTPQLSFCALSHVDTLDGNYQNNRFIAVNLYRAAQKEYLFRNHYPLFS
jgi:membrane protease YdiL (CAAX protease family)